MAYHISLRDIQFTPSAAGVRIVAYTDIECHLYCRLSDQEPRIHKTPSYRRGLWIADDVRFCFTVFEDNEQAEPGDTYIHTWDKPAWPPCTTKHLYLWGEVAAQVSPSTSPYFSYHNDYIAPPPPVDAMYQLNAIDPQFHTFADAGAWNLADLSRDIPPEATGAIFQFRNTDTGQAQQLALRKPGAIYDSYQPFQKDGTLWAIVGLDSQRRFQWKFGRSGYLHAYLMGYTGRDVVFPEDPIDIKPTVNNAYQTFDIKSTWPEAILILTDMGSSQAFNNYHSIRPEGSTKEIYQGDNRCFPFCGVPDSGNIQTKLFVADGISTQWLAYAYIKQDCSFSLNGVDLDGFTAFAWKTLNVGTLDPATRWAFLEYFHPFGAVHLSVRKQHSYFDFKGRNDNHGYMITHVHHSLEAQVYSDNTAEHDQLLQIAESH